jgi:hypothetical protein
MSMRLRVALLALVALGVAAALAACTMPAPSAASTPPWQARLGGDAVVLLGEVHDNADQHRLRLDALRRAFAAGWRPAVVMEQFDRERQDDIDRARRERPRDAQHVIDLAATPARSPGGGWQWDFYRPFVALALEHDVPLVAGNLSNADAARIVREGEAAVFDPAAAQALGLDRAIDAEWQQAQEREIDAGHCGALPAAMWPRMARAQFARDAVMARALTCTPAAAPSCSPATATCVATSACRAGSPWRRGACGRWATSREGTSSRRPRPSTRSCGRRRPNANDPCALAPLTAETSVHRRHVLRTVSRHASSTGLAC